MRTHKGSYWGAVQHEDILCDGIHSVQTAGHGGIIVDAKHLAAMPEQWRETPFSPGVCFEEDCDWCLPFVWFEAEILAGGDAWAEKVIKSGAHTTALKNDHPARYAEYLVSKQIA